MLEAPDLLRQGGASDGPRLRGSVIAEIFLVVLILVNTMSLILWTVPSLNNSCSFWFHLVEYATVAVFLVEYGLRFWE